MIAQELRIGNWVRYTDTNLTTTTVTGIPANSSGKGELQELTTALINIVLEDFEPIPLTPEILEKAGFEISKAEWEDGYYAFKTCITFYYEGENILRIHAGRPSKLDHIQHLHQLQNLYFALTGEELNIQL